MDNTERKAPAPGEKFKHFKNKLYQIVAVATHSETGEKLVIYQALYGDFEVYARPLDMFMSEVDKAKYPDVKQKYRFERIDLSKDLSNDLSNGLSEDSSEDSFKKTSEDAGETAKENHADTDANSDENTDVNPILIHFLEADTFKEKYEVLKNAGQNIDDQLVDSLAASMDVVIEDGPIAKRFDELKMCVRTRERFETDRFRN
ncbi:MAG: DUF1653 domain-containing protein [Lachnospiraceae bacterium]|nr:DUF1653 domain-containing protein [Lachnospiraceae bacterium]